MNYAFSYELLMVSSVFQGNFKKDLLSVFHEYFIEVLFCNFFLFHGTHRSYLSRKRACCKDDSDIFHPFSSPGGKSHPLPTLVFCKFNNLPSGVRIIGMQNIRSSIKNLKRNLEDHKSQIHLYPSSPLV